MVLSRFSKQKKKQVYSNFGKGVCWGGRGGEGGALLGYLFYYTQLVQQFFFNSKKKNQNLGPIRRLKG